MQAMDHSAIRHARVSPALPLPAVALMSACSPPPLVFDLRAGGHSGISRVASETVAAYQRTFPDDPVSVLTGEQGRYSLQAQREWPALRRANPGAVWVWFHWDVPWVRPPARSIVYIHDLIGTDPAITAWPKRQITRWWMGHAAAHASRLVTVSTAMAAPLRVRFAKEVAVIPNGVSPSWFGEWTPRDYLLTVGEPRRYKNFAVAHHVAAALGVRHRHAWGVSERELAALYAGARVVLVPSRAEGFGLPVLEAFASGAPVVASDIPALREVGGGLAEHVAPDDLTGWCEAVQRAWTDGGDPAVRRAWAATFRWERTATQLRAVAGSLG